MCTIKNYRFIISALGSAYINDYEKYTKEAFYLLNYLSEIILIKEKEFSSTLY